MLIEVFTNGKVIIDGLDAGKNYKAEDALYDYLTNPASKPSIITLPFVKTSINMLSPQLLGLGYIFRDFNTT